MGKHLNAKQRELEKKLKNQQKGMMYNKSTDAVSVPTLQAAPKKAAEASTLITPGTLKTKAKAMGLKSTLVFDDKIVVTSFLNSKTEENEKCAHIEKITDCNGQTIVEHPRMFNTSINAQQVDLSKDNDETNYPNPAFEDCGRDYINIKSALEKRVFGKTYNKDNLHVQIAYNIFDIKKIIGTYINNITYIFYNLGREEYNAKKDIIGNQDSDYINFNLHTNKYVKDNYEKISKMNKIVTEYRNNVQHLAVVNNITKYLGDISEVTSYYSLYCYILQRLLLDNNNNDKFAAIKEKLIKFGTYNKNFMWLINVPFAYNLPRYKNLSNEEIFYDVIQNK